MKILTEYLLNLGLVCRYNGGLRAGQLAFGFRLRQHFFSLHHQARLSGRDISVGIATRLRSRRPRFDSRQGKEALLSIVSRPALGTPEPHGQWVRGTLLWPSTFLEVSVNYDLHMPHLEHCIPFLQTVYSMLSKKDPTPSCNTAIHC
jgi:hypothetical protein